MRRAEGASRQDNFFFDKYLRRLRPGIEYTGVESSEYAVSKFGRRRNIRRGSFGELGRLGFRRSFDLVVSLGTLHNLKIFELQTALEEIERVGKNKYIMVESYRNELEQFNMQCWALTAEAFYDTASWIWLYGHFGYTGDYEFIYFE